MIYKSKVLTKQLRALPECVKHQAKLTAPLRFSANKLARCVLYGCRRQYKFAARH